MNTHDEVKSYYGAQLQKSEDLQTNACCTNVKPTGEICEALAQIHDEVHAKYYGCGLTIPSKIEGLKILDLGSGSGRDCYIASKLVGENGLVVGIDMTPEQLEVANKHIEYHREKFGYTKSNVRFVEGNLDALDELDLGEEQFDLVISNCVINLVEDKAQILKAVYKLLKPGGEMYFSDVYSDRRMPLALQKDPVLWGECLSGSLYWNDFEQLAKAAGFTDPRLVESDVITVDNEALEEKLGEISCFSATYRLFKIAELENFCEDYGQAVVYKGTISEHAHAFDLDEHHHFPKGKIMPVCGNTYRMLNESRYQADFEFYGSWEVHYGIFEGCGTSMPFVKEKATEGGGCC